jgi:hypothetical protein
MDTTTLGPIIVFAIKLLFVGSMALTIAVILWMLSHELYNGAVFESKPGRIRTRAQTPVRYWLHIVWQLLFVAATAVMIHVVIHLGDRRELPATNPREKQPESHASESRSAVWERGRPARSSLSQPTTSKMKRLAPLLFLAVVLTRSAGATHWPGEISPATIRLIEQQVVMPARADPLQATTATTNGPTCACRGGCQAAR